MEGKLTIKYTALLLIALLSACTGSVSGQREGAYPANAPYKKVLVVAFFDTDNTRLTAERELATSLSEGDTDAKSSMAMAPKMAEAPSTREEIIAMLKQTGADALVVMEPVDAETRLGKTQKEKYFEDHLKKTPVGEDIDESWASLGSSEERFALPDVKIEAEVTATVYDASEDFRPVYRVSASSSYKEKGGDYLYSLASDIAGGIARELRQQKLIN